MMMKIATARGWLFKLAMMESSVPGRKCPVLFVAVSFLTVLSGSLSAEVDPGVKQLIVSIAPGWNSTTGRLQCFERTTGVGRERPAWSALRENGIAWGAA